MTALATAAPTKSILTELAERAMVFLRDMRKEKISYEDLSKVQDACQTGKLQVLKEVLDRGFPINHVFDKDGMAQTAICIAAYYGHYDICKELIDRNADLEAKTAEGDTAIFRSLHSSYVNKTQAMNLARLFIDAGADYHALTKNGRNLVHESTRHRKVELMEYFMHLGVNPNAKDDKGDRPLHIAGANDFVTGCIALIEGGANSMVLNDNQSSPLDEALKWGNLDAAAQMIAFGNDFEILKIPSEGVFEVNGKTLETKVRMDAVVYALNHPMHHAAKSNRTDTLYCFLKLGHDPLQIDSNGKTVLEVSDATNTQGECSALIRSWESKGEALEILNEILGMKTTAFARQSGRFK